MLNGGGNRTARLTAEKVRGLRDRKWYGDGGGLYLYIAPGGTKSWVLRVRVDGRRADKGLGGYPAVSLTETRKAAEAYRVALRRGPQPRPTQPKARERRAAARSLTVVEAARRVHEALPDASFVGFTGTPIELQDANTRAFFGDYISVHDIRRSVEDGATVPIYYESRLAKLALDEAERPTIDPDFEEATEGQEVERKEKLKTRWA